MPRSLCLDFNSFFASVEQEEQPELRGLPVAIVPVLAESTSCIALSIEAKKLGVPGMARVADARRLCPTITILEARPHIYVEYHRRLLEVIESHLHITHVMSIDEVLCDLRGRWADPTHALATAKKIKTAIAATVGPRLRCSVGLAPNWLLAKVASDMQKPDGLVLIDDSDLPTKILPLDIGAISGIGPNMQRRLRAAGLDTMAKLWAASASELRRAWGGVPGERMWRLLHGEDLPWTEPAMPRTIGHSHVLPPEDRHPAAALAVLHRLLQKAAMRLRAAGLFTARLVVSVSYTRQGRWSDELSFDDTQDTLTLLHNLNTLWQRRPPTRQTPLKVGVTLLNLVSAQDHTPSLFNPAHETARTRLHAALDTLNQTYGKNTVYFGGAHAARQRAPMRIAFTRIPQPELEEQDRSRQRRLRPTPGSNPPAPAETDDLD